MAFIDYRKAYDSIPHKYLVQILKTYNVDGKIVNLMQHMMSQWKVTLQCFTTAGTIKTDPIHIRNGILQGDSFSTLWFCMGLNPLSNLLNEAELGFKIKAGMNSKKITHLLYVDDLKVYADSKSTLCRIIQLTEKFSKDVHMRFGIEKCSSVHIRRGQLQTTEGIQINEEERIKDLSEGENYKYLGFAQLKGINHTKIKEHLKEIVMTRITKICQTELNSGNKIKAINTWAIPALSYSFGIVKWSQTDIDNILTLIRVEMTKHRMHHPKAAQERVFLPREEGGRGIINIRQLHNNQIIKLRQYFKQNTNDLYKTIVELDTNFTPLNLSAEQLQMTTKMQTNEEIIVQWQSKQLHGTHPYELNQENIHKKSNIWLKEGKLHAETEGFIVAIQDRVIATRNYRKYIIGEQIDDKCRICMKEKQKETIEHIISGCEALANTEYIKRHNNIAKIIHQDLAKQNSFTSETIPYYKYNPKTILDNETHTIYWDRQIITDHQITANKPDITIINKISKTIVIVDVAIPLNKNVQKTYATKINKYLPLIAELKDMYRAKKVEIIPVVLSATGLVPHSLVQSAKKLGLEHLIPLMQRSVLLDTCNITRKIMNQ